MPAQEIVPSDKLGSSPPPASAMAPSSINPAVEATPNLAATSPDPNLTQSKESPLTDIGKSPPPFSLPFDFSHADLEPLPETLDLLHKNSSTYESSELSDLDDQSEAETDKMDFLEEQHANNISDLDALSKLTKLARLKEIDSDESDDMSPNAKRPSAEPEPHPKRAKTASVSPTGPVDEPTQPADEPADESPESPHQSSDESPNEPSPQPAESPSANGTTEVEVPPVEVLATAHDEPNDESEPEPEAEPEAEPESEHESEHEVLALAAQPDPQDDQESDSSEHVKASPTPKSESPEPEPEAEPEAEPAESEPAADEPEPEVDEPAAEPAEIKPELDEAESSAESEPEQHANGKVSDEKPDSDNETAEANEVEQDDDDEEDYDLNEQRKLAVEELRTIEKSFADLRDKLYSDKLKYLEHELQSCLEGSHPELSQIYYKINGFYQDSLRLANSTLGYRLKCIDTETMATRTSIHQDFLKKLMDSKNEMILNTTSLWYKINKERNQMDQLVPDYGFTAIPQIPNYTVPGTLEDASAVSGLHSMMNGNSHMEIPTEPIQLTKKAIKQNTIVELVQQRNDYNHQLGILNGLLQYHGFPSVINPSDEPLKIQELLMRKASDDEVAEDFKAMGIPI